MAGAAWLLAESDDGTELDGTRKSDRATPNAITHRINAVTDRSDMGEILTSQFEELCKVPAVKPGREDL
jgi:hypothetical protein